MEILKAYGPLVISILAFIVSYRGYRIARRTEKRAIAASKPLVSATITPVENEPDWFAVRLSIENRASHGYRGDLVSLRYPARAKGLTHSQTLEGPSFDPKRKVPLPLFDAKRSIPIPFEISKAGISGRPHPHSVDERHYETIFVYVPKGWFTDVVAMNVRLVSLEGLEKAENIYVWRKLPVGKG